MSTATAALARLGARRRVRPQRRGRRADRRRFQLVEDRLQGPDARREWIAVAVDRIPQHPREGGGLLIRQVKAHNRQMVPLTDCRESPYEQGCGMTSLDIEAILNDLHASEISGEISWVWDSGFRVAVGAPAVAEEWSLPTIRDAVLWLRDQACQHYPDSEFARKYGGFV
jgi:hypothetical protein